MHGAETTGDQYFPFLYNSLQGPKPIHACEIPIFRNFQFWPIISLCSLKIGYFELGLDYDATVTSYVGCWYLFWYVWKDAALAITIRPTVVPIGCNWGVLFSSSQGLVTNFPPSRPLVRRVTI